MQQWVAQEEDRLIDQAKMLQLAGEKKREASDLKKKVNSK